MNNIQKELDKAEEYMLTELFGNIDNLQISKNLQFALKFKGINLTDMINFGINKFESFAKDYMREDGFLDTEKIIKILAVQFPFLSGLNPPTIRLIDLIKKIDGVIPLRKIGEIIRKI